jgi:hypothetical protein
MKIMRKTKVIILSVLAALICFAAIGLRQEKTASAENPTWEIMYPYVDTYDGRGLLIDSNGNFWYSRISGSCYQLMKNDMPAMGYNLDSDEEIIDIDEDADGFIWVSVRRTIGGGSAQTRVEKLEPVTGVPIYSFEDSQLSMAGIAIDRRTNTMYIADDVYNRIIYYEITSGVVADIVDFPIPTLDIDVDAWGNLWGCRPGGTLFRLNIQTKEWQQLLMSSTPFTAYGVFCDNNNDVWVADAASSKVYRYLVRSSQWREYSGNFQRLRDIYVDNNYTVYCLDEFITYADLPSPECNVLECASPENATIQGNEIIAETVSATCTVNLSVSPGASWKLYSDAGCIDEIGATVNLQRGMNTYYVKVTAEDNTISASILLK